MAVARRPAALRVLHAQPAQDGGDDVDDEPWRPIYDHVPATRAECVDGPRPCPYVACRHHLLVTDSSDTVGRRWGGATPHADGRNRRRVHEPDGHPTCALDVAATGERSSREVGALLGLSKRQTNKVLLRALRKLADHPDAAKLLAEILGRGE